MTRFSRQSPWVRAPGWECPSKVDAVSRLATAAASRIEAGALTEQSVGELAVALGVSDRHLRRVVQQEFGVSPIQLAQTQRLLLAKRLLSDTHLSVADVAFASGFSSVRRLSALGILASRARTIRAIAQAVVSEHLQLHNYAGIQPTVAALKALPGIGDWTAQYIALRVLADPDAFPSGDLALRRALDVDRPSQVLKMAEAWRPWRAYAAVYLWKSLAACVK
ncbi:MAG: helix-turn-helix domain-containing protein [Phormidesmis sp.]